MLEVLRVQDLDNFDFAHAFAHVSICMHLCVQ